MINIFQTTKLGLKKIRFSKGKTLFVVIPISLMVAIIVIASSEAKNLINVAHNSIFSSIEGQNQVIELSKNSGLNINPFQTSNSDVGYTNTDITKIQSISNVTSAGLITEVPINNKKSSDLFAGKNVSLTSLSGLDSKYSNLYTNEQFNYKEGEAIPIILNANDFSEKYEDWQGKTEITVDLSKAFSSGEAPSPENDPVAKQDPSKTKAIAYKKEDLIGKTFTIQFGGLDDISTVKQEPSSTGFKFTKKSQSDIDSEINTRKTAISKYWNYDKISKPLTYTFKVVGIAEGQDKTTSYVPVDFAKKLMSDYLTNQLQARNGTAIPSNDQNSTYQGLVYDGVTIQNDSASALLAGLKKSVTGQVDAKLPTSKRGPMIVQNFNSGSIDFKTPDASSSYNIPGLVFSKDRSSGLITGEYKSFDLTKALPIQSNNILIRINDIKNREQVITDLNSNGYSITDFSKYKEFNKLENYLYSALNIGSIVFMVVTALFILINMAKSVSEGRKEIGIFRAIGASRTDIRIIFIMQSLLYIVFSIIIGILLGIAAIYALGSTMVSSSQGFITSTIGSIINLSGNISTRDFLGIDYKTLLIYGGVLLVVTLIVSLIPSEQAAKVSPVEAIRN